MINWQQIFDQCRQLHSLCFAAAIFQIGIDYLDFDPESAGYPHQWKQLSVNETPLLADPLSKYLAKAVPRMDPCIFSDFSGNGTSISMASFKAMAPSRRMVSTMAALFFGTKVIPADFSRIICHKNRCPPNPSDAVLPVDT